MWTHNDLRLPSKVTEKLDHTSPLFQRKIWLREALADVCKGQMDEVEQMKQCLAVLRKEGMSESDRDGEEERDEEEDEDERESAFEMLSELCENLDNARG